MQVYEDSSVNNVFCDIAGTAMIQSESVSEYVVNKDVVAFLRFLREAYNFYITLCSRIPDNAIAHTSLKREFGEVVGKANLQSQNLDLLIDNNTAEYLTAKVNLHPDQLTGFAELSDDNKARFISDMEKSSGFSFAIKTLS